MSFTKDRSVKVLAYLRSEAVKAGGFSGYKQTSVIHTLVRTRVGVSNPNFRTQIANHQNACTNMTGIFQTLDSEYGSGEVFHRDANALSDKTIYRNWFKGDIALMMAGRDFSWAFSLNETLANNRALIAYLKKARSVVVAFSAPTFIGEFKESVHMIRHPAEGLRNLCKSFADQVKKLKKQRPKEWKKNLGGLWLENAFGWQPLISDISTAFDVYKHHTRDIFVPISGFGKEAALVPSKCRQNVAVNLDGNTVAGYYYSVRATDACIVKYKGMYRRHVETPGSLFEKLEPYGFDPLEFVPTAWELLPWSFLIDYFSNIGDVITANCALRSNIIWTNRTRVDLKTLETTSLYDKILTSNLNPLGTYISGHGTGPSCKATSRSVTRIAGVAFDTPYLAFELPNVVSQFENMTALFAQCSRDIHPQRVRGH